MQEPPFRQTIRHYVQNAAKPPDKFSHQARLYKLALELAEDGSDYDQDVLFAAAWLHDLGVFIGHRPADPEQLSKWDHLAYVVQQAPGLLLSLGFPEGKIEAVLKAIESHLPSGSPTSLEGVLLRDADILEQLGSVGILRTVSKVGRDTRFTLFSDALRVLRYNLERLPAQLRLEKSKQLAEPRIHALKHFLDAAEKEANGVEW